MFKTVLFLTLVASCLGDNAPTGGYGAPSGGGYDAPTGYDAPQAGYGDYDQGGYELADEGGDDIGAKLGELIPLFLVVFAAIILAQLLAPLLLSLLGIVVGILPMALSIKAPIVNLILNPFGLQLCTTAAVPVVFFPAGATVLILNLNLMQGLLLLRPLYASRFGQWRLGLLQKLIFERFGFTNL